VADKLGVVVVAVLVAAGRAAAEELLLRAKLLMNLEPAAKSQLSIRVGGDRKSVV
jgi:hypothetical protein